MQTFQHWPRLLLTFVCVLFGILLWSAHLTAAAAQDERLAAAMPPLAPVERPAATAAIVNTQTSIPTPTITIHLTAPPPLTVTPSATPTATQGPTPTPSATATATPPPPKGDVFELDNDCTLASQVATTGARQRRTFHLAGDVDWVRFSAKANKTYIIRVENGRADAIFSLYDACTLTPLTTGSNTFGSEVTLAWDSTKNGDYWLQLQQFDGAGGAELDYTLTLSEDNTPPAEPENVRCVAVDATTLGVQWQTAPERDVKRYIVQYVGRPSGNINVNEANATFAQIPNLTPGEAYQITIRAFDFSSNASEATLPLPCALQPVDDGTVPDIQIESPSSTGAISTTSTTLTFNGQVFDPGANLSRVEVRNVTLGVSKWDYSLTGERGAFRIKNLALQTGDNQIAVSAFDAAGNIGQRSLTVQRLTVNTGAALIIAGRNETSALQLNIYHAANRAYRILHNAGYSDEAIFYIAPTQQDADNDGVQDDVDKQPGAPADLQQALLTWASDKVGPDRPLFVYLIDHGFVDKFCLAGCHDAGVITPSDLAGWLNVLEAATGVDAVTVVIEACLSGSFISRAGGADLQSLSKAGRVIITSTSDAQNAYASAKGAYFSDAFFSCVADSNNFKVCFDQAQAAVAALRVAQTPYLDDNGDGVYQHAADGALAATRSLTRFFAATRPVITAAQVQRIGVNGVLTATVEEGAEAIDAVWAAIYAPSFSEPSDAIRNPTLNLNAPTVRLQPVSGEPGSFREQYPNGFVEPGAYRVIFYAQDSQGIHALPFAAAAPQMYLPFVRQE